MYKALYDYQTSLSKYLTFKAGDQFTVLDKSHSDWYLAQNGFGEIGYIPINYVKQTVVEESQVLKSIDRAIEAIHYQAVSAGGHYSNTQRENLQQLIKHRTTVAQSYHGHPSQEQATSPAGDGKSKTRSLRRHAPPPPVSPESHVTTNNHDPQNRDPSAEPMETVHTVDSLEESGETAHTVDSQEESASSASKRNCPVTKDITDAMPSTNTQLTDSATHTIQLSPDHATSALQPSIDRATSHIHASVDCATSPIPSPSKLNASSSGVFHPGLVDVNSVTLPSTIGVELIEEVRRNTGLSYKKSGVAIETVLGHLGYRVPQIAPLLDRLFSTLHEQTPTKLGEEETSSDYMRLTEIFTELAVCKDDSQQRGWHLHEDEDVIAGHLEDVLSILENAKQSVCQKAVARGSYECVYNLVQYYQMELRQRLRLLLLRMFGAMCALDSSVVTLLLCSILTTELAEEIQSNMDDVARMNYVSLLLSMLFSTGESVPANLHEHLNGKFLQCVLDAIENPPSLDHEDQVSDLLVTFILAFNLHLTDPHVNLLMDVINERRTVKVVTEKVLLFFNRDEDPVHMFEHEPRPPDAVMKFLQDLYARPATSAVLYTNDARVLIDIVLRHLIDLSPGDKARTSHLRLMQLILENSDYPEHRHRFRELSECLHRIGREEDGSPADQDIVTCIFAHTDLFNN